MKVYKITDNTEVLKEFVADGEQFTLSQELKTAGGYLERADVVRLNKRELLVLHQAISDCILNKEEK